MILSKVGRLLGKFTFTINHDHRLKSYAIASPLALGGGATVLKIFARWGKTF